MKLGMGARRFTNSSDERATPPPRRGDSDDAQLFVIAPRMTVAMTRGSYPMTYARDFIALLRDEARDG